MSDVPTIIREIADRVGTTAEHAWPLYVKFIWADALIPSIVGASVAVSAVLGYLALLLVSRSFDDAEAKSVSRTAGLLIAVLICAISLCEGPGKHMAAVIAPEGAAIHTVVKRVTQ